MEFREKYHDILASTSSEDWPEIYTVALLLLSEISQKLEPIP
jgi:hypothetical protein